MYKSGSCISATFMTTTHTLLLQTVLLNLQWLLSLFRKAKHDYEQAELPLDYFSECQQQKQQFYASMLRDKDRQQAQYLAGGARDAHDVHDATHQQTQQLLLQCPYGDTIPQTVSPTCPAHAHHATTSPYPVRGAVTSHARAPVSDQTSVYHALPSFSSTPDCVQHTPTPHGPNRST